MRGVRTHGPRPSRSSSAIPRGVRPSPQVLSRGNVAASASTTSEPSRAAHAAADAPAGPAPTTRTSVRVGRLLMRRFFHRAPHGWMWAMERRDEVHFASRGSSYFDVLLAGFCVVLVVSNIAATKGIEFGSWEFSIGSVQISPVVTDGGAFLFPLAYILGDVISEVYGFRAARRAIFTGLRAWRWWRPGRSGSSSRRLRRRSTRTRPRSRASPARWRRSCSPAWSATWPASSSTPGCWCG